MISIVLVITMLVPNLKPVEHRVAVPSVEECVRRGTEFLGNVARTFPSGGKLTIGCEFTKQ